MVDPQDVIMAMRPGMAIYARLDAGEGDEMALLLREESERIRRLGPSPRVEIRTGLFMESGVALIPILVRVGPTNGPLDVFECWLNVHQDESGMQYLDDLARQPRILVILYGDQGRERMIEARSLLQDTFGEMRRRVQELPPWPMRAFDLARERFYRRYPTPQKLWKEIGRY